MKYILALVVVSYALRCLSFAAINGREVATILRKSADKIEREAQDAPHDAARRFVEGVWFLIYLLIAYKLVRM